MVYKEERIKREASYILETKETVREIAKKFKVSKSTVHKDLHERLKLVDFDLYQEVDAILKYHKEIRHLRGGESTRQKYLKEINK
ncbi:MAG: HTH domain-containing protein [Bacilli bacterium]|nr:HTH domain-containing protein [Bacilli bacterium]